MILETSDAHLNPGNRCPEHLIDMADKADMAKSPVVWNGDMLNILPLGMRAWRSVEGRFTIVDLVAKGMPEKGIYFIMGNHEGRLSWVKELFGPYPDVIICRNLDLTHNGRKWHFDHGHKFTDWWLWRHIADDWCEWITTNPLMRKWWYDFCVKQGWIPSKYMHDWTGNPVSKFQQLVGYYWGRVLQEALSKNRNYCVGHSHIDTRIDTPFGISVVDGGVGKVNIIE